MLYVRCGNCGSVGPFMCTGAFMMHPPMPTAACPSGAFCQWCGVLPAQFMCGYCGTWQPMYVQGAQPPRQQFGAGPQVAAAVQAPAGSSGKAVQELIMAFLKGAAGEAGKGVGGQFW